LRARHSHVPGCPSSHQARIEVSILQLLHGRGGGDEHIVQLGDYFSHCRHLCLVFELLHINLYELLKQNNFRGLSTSLLRLFLGQLLGALQALRHSGIIHCDIKPENVLLVSLHSGQVKLIDFGSACADGRTVYSYIQSRFYRAPEVVLGCSYGPAIDMWSLGAVAAELFLGLPLFPGASEHNLLTRITDALGPLPDRLLAAGKNTAKFFKQTQAGWQMMSPAEHEAVTGKPAALGKRYFAGTTLADIIAGAPMRKGLSEAELATERTSRAALLDWLLGVMAPDPQARWTPAQAALHPFITGNPMPQQGRWSPPQLVAAAPALQPQSPQAVVPAFHVGSPMPSPQTLTWPGGGFPVGQPHSPQFAGMLAQHAAMYGSTPPGGGFLHSPHSLLVHQHAATAHLMAQQQATAAAMFGMSPPVGAAWGGQAAAAGGWHPASVPFGHGVPPQAPASMQRRSSAGARDLASGVGVDRSPRLRQSTAAQRRRLSEGGATLEAGGGAAMEVESSPRAAPVRRLSQGLAGGGDSPTAAVWDPAFSDDMDDSAGGAADASMAAHVAALAQAHAQAHVMQLAQLQLHQAHAAAMAQGWGMAPPPFSFSSSPGAGAFGHPLPPGGGPQVQQGSWGAQQHRTPP
jgi:dual specificity protein kinase YAK1